VALNLVEDREPPLPELGAQRYLNRELSALDYAGRVLAMVEDGARPVLERARFCAIFATALDEFFYIRVAGLKDQVAAGIGAAAPDGMSPAEQLVAIRQRVDELLERTSRTYLDDVVPHLAEAGIRLVDWDSLDDADRKHMAGVFDERIFPVLTPLAVDPGHPFPYISNLSLNLAVIVRDSGSGERRFARVKVPPLLPRFVEADSGRYVPVEDVIAAHLELLFPGMEILDHHAFRVTRNEDLEVEADTDENLLQALERELMRRRFGPPVRLEVDENIRPQVLDLLIRELDINEDEVFKISAPLDLTGLNQIADIGRSGEYSELRFKPFVTKTHPDLADEGPGKPADIFAAIRRRDILLHHPYDSFATSVQAFLEQAAEDPDVLAIKQTLYRTSGDSPIVDALIDAARPASRCWSWWRSRRASTSTPTSPGPASWSRPAATWSTA